MSTIRVATNDVVTAALAAVSQIDLSPINEKLRYENPTQWTDEILVETETNYRRFLALNILYPSESLVVNKSLDDYWHQHILDTRKYAADCEKIFGSFLHHYPYFGIRSEDERQEQLEGFAITQQLWEEAFGVPLVGESKLTLDKILGAYQPEPKGVGRQPVYAFPQACKNGQHCQRTIVPDRRIIPQKNPQINPSIISQIKQKVGTVSP